MTPTDLSQLMAIAVAALCGIVIPFLVDLVTKSHAPNGLKAAAAAALAAGAGVLSTTNLADGFHWPTLVIAVASAFVMTMATHLTGASDVVQRATPNVGIGGTPPADPLGDGGVTVVGLVVIVVVVLLLLALLGWL